MLDLYHNSVASQTALRSTSNLVATDPSALSAVSPLSGTVQTESEARHPAPGWTSCASVGVHKPRLKEAHLIVQVAYHMPLATRHGMAWHLMSTQWLYKGQWLGADEHVDTRPVKRIAYHLAVCAAC